jgi:hypothetical protein
VVNGQKLRVMPDSANALLRTQARETEQSRSAGGSKVIVFGKGTGGALGDKTLGSIPSADANVTS